MLMETAPASPAQSADANEAPSRLTLVLDWLAFVVFAGVTLRLAVRASGPVTDPDTWWHLRLGEEFRGPWSLGHPGQLTPFATRPWFATQWTLELVASYVNDAFGLAGVSWLAGFGVVVLAVAVYVSCRQRGGVTAAALAASVALVGTSMSHGPRPQMASFILVAVFTAAWLRTVDDLKPRWWLIPLTWLWACTHGMWFMGVLVGFAVAVGLILDRRVDRGTALRLGAIPVGGVLAAMLTPVGPRLILAGFFTSKTAPYITEWLPPKFSELVPGLALLMVAFVVVAWARGGCRRSWAEILLLGLALGWIVMYYRTIAVGVVIAAPLVAGVVQALRPNDLRRRPRWEVPVLLIVAFSIIAGLAVAAPYRKPPPLNELESINAALDRMPAGTVVYDDYGLGGWLEYRHRNVAPVIDGMTDGYPVKYVLSYIKAYQMEPGWRKFVVSTHAEYALLEWSAPMAAELRDEGWKTVVHESKYVLLRRAPAWPHT